MKKLIFYTKLAFMGFFNILDKIFKSKNYRDRKNNKLFDETWVVQNLNPDVFIDVGANLGQYSFQALRRGFNGKVITIEPVKYFFDEIVASSKNQKNWININAGVSDKKGTAEIYVCAGHGGCSSFLQPTKYLKENAGASGELQRKEKISLTTLDSIINEHCPKAKNIYIKVDVQGFELQVMQGLKEHIDKVIGCRLEMAVNTNDDKNQPNMWEIIEYMRGIGFSLVHLNDDVWRHPKTKELLYVDGVFLNKNKLDK